MEYITSFINQQSGYLSIYYIIFVLSLVRFLLLKELPENRAIKTLLFYRLFDWNKYDVSETVQRNRQYSIRMLQFSVFGIVFEFLFGTILDGTPIGLLVMLLTTLLLFASVASFKRKAIKQSD